MCVYIRNRLRFSVSSGTAAKGVYGMGTPWLARPAL